MYNDDTDRDPPFRNRTFRDPTFWEYNQKRCVYLTLTLMRLGSTTLSAGDALRVRQNLDLLTLQAAVIRRPTLLQIAEWTLMCRIEILPLNPNSTYSYQVVIIVGKLVAQLVRGLANSLVIGGLWPLMFIFRHKFNDVARLQFKLCHIFLYKCSSPYSSLKTAVSSNWSRTPRQEKWEWNWSWDKLKDESALN